MVKMGNMEHWHIWRYGNMGHMEIWEIGKYGKWGNMGLKKFPGSQMSHFSHFSILAEILAHYLVNE